jgi:hypothetical protein
MYTCYINPFKLRSEKDNIVSLHKKRTKQKTLTTLPKNSTGYTLLT